MAGKDVFLGLTLFDAVDPRLIRFGATDRGFSG